MRAGGGGIVERAVVLALRYLERTRSLVTPISTSTRCSKGQGHQGVGRSNEYGDILAVHKGALRIIDVMFSSKAEKTVKALEQEKTNQYRHRRTECYKRNISPPFWSRPMVDGGSR